MPWAARALAIPRLRGKHGAPNSLAPSAAYFVPPAYTRPNPRALSGTETAVLTLKNEKLGNCTTEAGRCCCEKVAAANEGQTATARRTCQRRIDASLSVPCSAPVF